MYLRFAKMHGLGNDFMVVEWPAEAPEPDRTLVRQWSDRRLGIGFDQLLLIRNEAPVGDAAYRVFNYDGGEVEQCGNGARCIARYLASRAGNGGLNGRASVGELLLASAGGMIEARVLGPDLVSVNLGVPDFRPASLPFDAAAFLKTLSQGPGVYRMLDTGGKVLYVGKARNLKRRVTSYFRKRHDSAKTRALMSHTDRVEVTLTRTETEALILENNQIKHYQPRYNMAGRLMALEALARWQHPEQGLLPARRFIPVAEEAGLMSQLGLMLLDEACGQARAWLDEGLHAPIAYNMSGQQLASPLIAQEVEGILRKHALPAHLLEIQIDETAAVIDVTDTTLKLMQLRRLGVRLLLDDIGSGFSNLAILRRFQLDGIKITREFTRQLGASPDDPDAELGSGPVVSALVDLGRDLGVQIIAEGVETNRQLDFLRSAGVTQVQGHLFSHALPPERATALLRTLDSEL